MSNLVATYARPSGGPRVLIEQSDYAPFTGMVSRYAVATLLANLIYGTKEEIPVDCGFDGRSFLTMVLFYPEDPEMTFTAHVSRGLLGQGLLSESIRSEIINFRLDAAADLKYPALELVGTQWLGEAYDADMQLVPAPALALSGGKVRPASRVYGSARVTYKTMVVTCTCVIEAREEALENLFSAVAFAVHAGGIDWEILSPPPGADELKGDCAGGKEGIINPPDDPDGPPSAPGANRYIDIDYCSQQVISDTVI